MSWNCLENKKLQHFTKVHFVTFSDAFEHFFFEDLL